VCVQNYKISDTYLRIQCSPVVAGVLEYLEENQGSSCKYCRILKGDENIDTSCI